MASEVQENKQEHRDDPDPHSVCVSIHEDLRRHRGHVNRGRPIVEVPSDIIENRHDILTRHSDAVTVTQSFELEQLADHDLHLST